MNENIAALLELSGTPSEQNWLRENLETLSVREGTILAAALKRRPPASMTDVINHVLSLEEYAADLLQQEGYVMTADELGFVRRDDGPEQTQSPGMTMQ